jgi:hypothetical protein
MCAGRPRSLARSEGAPGPSLVETGRVQIGRMLYWTHNGIHQFTNETPYSVGSTKYCSSFPSG